MIGTWVIYDYKSTTCLGSVLNTINVSVFDNLRELISFELLLGFVLCRPVSYYRLPFGYVSTHLSSRLNYEIHTSNYTTNALR